MTDAPEGYRAALEGLAVHRRADRAAVRVGGRAPVRMLEGVLTSTIPSAERRVEPGVREGRAWYSTLLTPKGRMVSDLRVLRLDGAAERPAAATDGAAADRPRPPAPGGGAPAASMMRGPAMAPGPGDGSEALLLDLPAEALDGVLEHFGRFLPPRFAEVEDVSDGWALITVMGPEAADRLSLRAAGLRVDVEALAALREGEYRHVDAGAGDGVRIVRNADVAATAFDVLADPQTADALRRTLLSDDGAVEMERATYDILRVEAGRPAFGVDMDRETIPVEAGLGERAIDHSKGCYTGQEVIVRIRDRGRVNRTLRGLRLGAADGLPLPGTDLFAPDVRGDREAGCVTSVAESPRMGPVALAYVRREVASGGAVRVGAPDGPEARVAELEGPGWGPEDAATEG